MAVETQEITDKYAIYNGDCIEVLSELQDESIHFSVYSPPFADLYNYSSSEYDMSNCRSYEQFLEHYEYLIKEISRVTKPGRLSAVHCTDIKIPGASRGMRDLPGDIIKIHQDNGFVYHTRHCIWKEPLRVAIRTRAQGLMHKQIVKDSTLCHAANADYICVFRKKAGNEEPVSHPDGLSQYSGERPIPEDLLQKYGNGWKDPKTNKLSHWIWQQYASAFWDDIRIGRVLPYKGGRDSEDEKHVCVVRGSLVLTRRGHIPIENVQVGDETLTHEGRWRRITATRCMGMKSVVHVKAQGVADLRLTPDHKMWFRSPIGPGRWPGMMGSTKRPRESAMKNEPEWISSIDTVGGYVNQKLPLVEESELTETEWWIVGRWLGDGHLSTRGLPYISCNFKEADDLIVRLGERAGHAVKRRTSVQIYIKAVNGKHDDRLHRMIEKCGKGAANKIVPFEAISLNKEKSEAILSGYLSADGHYVAQYDRYTASSVSRALLLGMSLITQRARGAVASVYAGRTEREHVIEERTVHAKQDWIFGFRNTDGYKKSGFIADDGAWKKVRCVDDAGKSEVWDIQVEEDESFSVEGCIVHNCPLQIDVIERCLTLWSNPGDVVLTPFMGVGSEVYAAIRYDRKAIGIELKKGYYNQAVKNIHDAIDGGDSEDQLTLAM